MLVYQVLVQKLAENLGRTHSSNASHKTSMGKEIVWTYLLCNFELMVTWNQHDNGNQQRKCRIFIGKVSITSLGKGTFIVWNVTYSAM